MTRFFQRTVFLKKVVFDIFHISHNGMMEIIVMDQRPIAKTVY